MVMLRGTWNMTFLASDGAKDWYASPVPDVSKMLHRIVLPPRASFQAVRDDTGFTCEIPILRLDSKHGHTDSAEHGKGGRHRHKRITRVLVEQGELAARASSFPEPVLDEAETDHTAIRTTSIGSLCKKTHFKCFQNIVHTIGPLTENIINKIASGKFNWLPLRDD